MQIRQATLADVPAIVAMSERFYETTEFPHRLRFPFDPDTVRKIAESLAAEHVMLMAEHEGEVVGMVGLYVLPFMFNANHASAHEIVWWVNPEAQGTGAGKALLAAIEPACAAKGAEAIYMVHLATSPPQAAAIYERMGYLPTESSYVKRI